MPNAAQQRGKSLRFGEQGRQRLCRGLHVAAPGGRLDLGGGRGGRLGVKYAGAALERMSRPMGAIGIALVQTLPDLVELPRSIAQEDIHQYADGGIVAVELLPGPLDVGDILG